MRCLGSAVTENRARCAIALTVFALVSSGGAANCAQAKVTNAWANAAVLVVLGHGATRILSRPIRFRRNQLVSVGFSFKSSEFERVTGVFVERYGLPTTDSIEPFKSPKGVESTNRTLKWLGPVIAIYLTRYNRDITRGFAIIQTRAELEESEAIRRRIYGGQ